MRQVYVVCNIHRIFFPADAEKAGEEKDKEKEKREDMIAAAETDTKDKSEAADMKKGTSHSLKTLMKRQIAHFC